jgi:hypothetical protein
MNDNTDDDIFEQIKEAIKSVEWAGKPNPETLETPNKELGEYMRDVLAAVDSVRLTRRSQAES